MFVVPPAAAIGLIAGVLGQAVGMNRGETALFLRRDPLGAVVLGEQGLDGNIVQGGQILDLGKADVHHFQLLALRQGGEVFNIAAEGRLKEFQLLAVGERRQVGDIGAGNDNGFQLWHSLQEGEVRKEGHIVVSYVHEPHVLAVDQILGVLVRQLVGAADDLGIGHAAAAAVRHAPDHLGLVPVVLTELRHAFIGDLAVFQHEAAAVLHQIQRQPGFRQSLLADVRILDVNLRGFGGGKGLAVEVEDIVEGCRRSCFFQGLDVLFCQARGAVGFHQLHAGQSGKHTQLFAHACHIPGTDSGQVQLGGVHGVLRAADVHRAVDGDVPKGRFQLVDLLQGQLRLFQRDLLHVGQILEILHQRIVVIVPDLQRQLGDVRREGLASQIDFVKNLAPGQLLLGGFQNRVIAASGGVQGFQLGEIV